jgi:hypothetical protein
MENKLQIIETPDYTLAVSDKHHIDKNGLYYDTFDKSIKTSDCYQQSFRIKEIIAYQPKGNAPELDLPLLPEIVVEDDVEKLAKAYTKTGHTYCREKTFVEQAFITGYNKCLENLTK